MKSAKSPAPASPPESAPRAGERIRRTASELFYERGIRAIGVDEIVQQAGVTKPSLYRHFASKDELAAACLRDYDAQFWQRFDAGVETHPDDPRAQLHAYLAGLAQRAASARYRGCGMSNAAVEYPETDHPAHQVALASKQALRERLRAMARAMGAREADALGDGLLLLIEGAFVSGQLFGKGGPARAVAQAADLLIEASLRSGAVSAKAPRSAAAAPPPASKPSRTRTR